LFSPGLSHPHIIKRKESNNNVRIFLDILPP
jgi:hypothetical protein